MTDEKEVFKIIRKELRDHLKIYRREWARSDEEYLSYLNSLLESDYKLVNKLKSILRQYAFYPWYNKELPEIIQKNIGKLKAVIEKEVEKTKQEIGNYLAP